MRAILERDPIELTTTLEPPESAPLHHPQDNLEIIRARRWCAVKHQVSGRVPNVGPVQEARVEVHVEVQARTESLNEGNTMIYGKALGPA